jgi:hypothetical protein
MFSVFPDEPLDTVDLILPPPIPGQQMDYAGILRLHCPRGERRRRPVAQALQLCQHPLPEPG